MRNLLLLILVLLLGLSIHHFYGRSVPQAPQPQPVSSAPTRAAAPDFPFTTLDGKTYQLSELRGKIVLLNFWASWCAPCKVEFPQFLALAKERKNVVILALSVDHDRQALEKFVADQAELKKLPNVLIAQDKDKAVAQDLFQTIRFPETILIDTQGGLVRKYVGLEVDWSSTAFMGQLDGLANAP